MNSKRVYRLTARDTVWGKVETLGEFDTHEAALDAIARDRRDKFGPTSASTSMSMASGSIGPRRHPSGP